MSKVVETILAINNRRVKCELVYSDSDDVFAQANVFEGIFDNILDAVKLFLSECVEFPSKEVFLTAVETILDEVMAPIAAPAVIKGIVKRFILKAASELYDIAFEKFNNLMGN